MANRNGEIQQYRGNFEKIQSSFYEIIEKEEPILQEWTLEKMPKNVNTKRIRSNRNGKYGEWYYRSYNTKGVFRCLKCIKNGCNQKDATWTSAYVTILFRAYYGIGTDEYGQKWVGGWVQMKTFAQQCKNCNIFATAEIDEQRCKNVAKWLHKWIAYRFYGFPSPHRGYRGKESEKHHMADLCEACDSRWCVYYARSDT